MATPSAEATVKACFSEAATNIRISRRPGSDSSMGRSGQCRRQTQGLLGAESLAEAGQPLALGDADRDRVDLLGGLAQQPDEVLGNRGQGFALRLYQQQIVPEHGIGQRVERKTPPPQVVGDEQYRN